MTRVIHMLGWGACLSAAAVLLAGCAARGYAPLRASSEVTPAAEPAAAADAPAVGVARAPAAAGPGERPDPGPEVRAEQFRLAYRMMLNGQFRRAEAGLVALLAAYTEAGETAGLDEVLFWLAHCREQLGRNAESAATYRRLLARFPASDYAADARERVGALAGPATRPASP